MKINEYDVIKGYVPEEKDLKHAHDHIDRWEAVRKITGTPGWQVFKEAVEKQLEIHDSLTNTTRDDFEYKRGYVEGLNKLLQMPTQCKQNATSASEFLKTIEGLAQTEE